MEELVLYFLKEFLPSLEKRILIMLTGGTVNTELLLKILDDGKGNQYDLVISDHGKAMIAEESIRPLKGTMIHSFQELDQSLQSSDLILIPVMTRNTLVKAALGIADNLVTTGIARALMMNKEVIAVRDSFNPREPINIAKDLSQNHAYNAMIEQYEKSLASFGVKFVNLTEFKEVIRMKDRKFALESVKPANEAVTITSSILTLEELKRYENRKVMKVGPGTIITPLAKDYMEDHQISVEYV